MARRDKFFQRIDFTPDSALPQLGDLFDPAWVWLKCQARLPPEYGEPKRMRIRRFLHSVGRNATVCYELHWHSRQYLPTEFFVATIERDRLLQFRHFPDDDLLPGLAAAARPESALRLFNQHVLTVPAPPRHRAGDPLPPAFPRRLASSHRQSRPCMFALRARPISQILSRLIIARPIPISMCRDWRVSGLTADCSGSARLRAAACAP